MSDTSPKVVTRNQLHITTHLDIPTPVRHFFTTWHYW